MTIRPLELERDADDLVRIAREVVPTAVIDRRALVHRIRTLPERAEARAWVAEVDGEVVGRADVFRNFFTKGSRRCFAGVMVQSEHRRTGIGGELYELVAEHARLLEADGIVGSFHENEAGVAFAKARGFRESRAERESLLDPRTVGDRPPAHLDIRPVSQVDPRLVYEVDMQATADMPFSEPIDHIPFDEWTQHVVEHPLFSTEGSFVVIEDEIAVAVSLFVADHESGRAFNMFTGTLPAHRGRGLALAVKLATIHWAAAHGITTIVTTNDETNAPMLAINRRLGYRPSGRNVEYLREPFS